MSDDASNSENKITGSAHLTNAVGLHARPSVKLTQLAKSFSASITVATDASGPWIDAKSPVKIMRVKAPKGTTLYIQADGADARKAVAALIDLINRRFDEEDEAGHG